MFKPLILSFLILSVFSPLIFAQDSSAPLTLEECFRRAMKQSEMIRVSEESIKEAEARFTQAFSQILPRLSYEYDYAWQEESDDGHESRFHFTQPLFRGFKEYAAMDAGRAFKRQQEFELARARQLLFTDVYNAFYLLLIYEEDLKSLQDIKNILESRRAELQKRFDLGRSRESEILSADVRLRRLEADIEQVANHGQTARQLLEFLTGQPVESIMDADLPEISALKLEHLLKNYNRPDVAADREALEVARHTSKSTRGELYPDVSLDGNYYTNREDSSDADGEWDVTLNVEVPLFEGRQTRGQYEEDLSAVRKAEWNLQESQRRAELDIRQSYTNFISSMKRFDLLQQAQTAAEKNYAFYQEEFNRNLVSNLDVLDVLEELQDVRRDSIAAKAQMKQNYWTLKTSAGDIPHASF